MPAAAGLGVEMFGDDNKDDSSNDNSSKDGAQVPASPAEPAAGLQGFTMDQSAATDKSADEPQDNPALPPASMPPEPVSAPTTDDSGSDEPKADEDLGATDSNTLPADDSQTDSSNDTDQPDDGSSPSAAGDNDLIGIKEQALKQLSPLVGHLDQSPEEKFKTTMMMIQASDDQSLVPTAYEAAQQISDEKTKAQALLDVVNEINYFTQQKS